MILCGVRDDRRPPLGLGAGADGLRAPDLDRHSARGQDARVLHGILRRGRGAGGVHGEAAAAGARRHGLAAPRRGDNHCVTSRLEAARRLRNGAPRRRADRAQAAATAAWPSTLRCGGAAARRERRSLRGLRRRHERRADAAAAQLARSALLSGDVSALSTAPRSAGGVHASRGPRSPTRRDEALARSHRRALRRRVARRAPAARARGRGALSLGTARGAVFDASTASRRCARSRRRAVRNAASPATAWRAWRDAAASTCSRGRARDAAGASTR